MAAARADADMGADTPVATGTGASLALAMAAIAARLQANRALKCRMEIQKVEYLLVYGWKATKLESARE
jgi:hypothetical protein